MKAGFRIKKNSLLIIFIILIIFGYIIWHSIAPSPEQWKTIEVARHQLERNVLATGKLDAVRKVDVGAQVSGQLQSLFVEIGDKVIKNQLLAVIDPKQALNQIRETESTLRELRAQQMQANARYDLSSTTALRKQKLAQKQLISRQELDESMAEIKIKKAEVKSIAAQIARNNAALDTARTNLEYTRIVAPINGVVTQITTQQGQTVIAAQQAPNILTLADMDTMLVKAQVSEADIIYLHLGQKAWFTILGDTTTRYEGKLKDILPTPEKINDAIFYYARFEVVNTRKLLRLEMTAQVHILLDAVSNTLTIPLFALGSQISDNVYRVAVLEKGQPVLREITVGDRNDIDVQVLSGIKEGDKIIPGYNEAAIQ